MKITELIRILKNTKNDNITDIDIEDYEGNTIFKLSDLDLADIDDNTIRLQSNLEEEKNTKQIQKKVQVVMNYKEIPITIKNKVEENLKNDILERYNNSSYHNEDVIHNTLQDYGYKCNKCNCYTRYKGGMCFNCSVIAETVKAVEQSAEQMSRTI